MDQALAAKRDPYDLDPSTVVAGLPRQISEREAMIVAKTLQRFAQLQLPRNTFASQWEEAAELILPTSRNTFMYGNFNWPGQKKTDRQIDATGMMALHRFSAICDSLMTPRNMFWHALGPEHDHLMRSRKVRLWFDEVTRMLFRMRYSPHANFIAPNALGFQGLGAFGNACLFVDTYDGLHGERGFRYKNIPLGQCFVAENHQGTVWEMIRWFRMTALQVKRMWPDTFPEIMGPALKEGSETYYNILHHTALREDWDPEARLTPRGKPFFSHYVSIEGKCLLEEGNGYYTFPYIFSRYEQMQDEVYGRGPAQMILPALKTLNFEKRIFLKTGHRAADPILLTADDGLVDINMRPGAMNKGAMTPDGKPMVGILPTGSVQITQEMMTEERNLINDAFLVSLFQVLTETPTMTATEVIERTNEKGILLAPTVGRQTAERLGPQIERELDLLAQMGVLPPMPPELQEVGGAYAVEYTSPLAKAMRAQNATGFMRTVEIATNIANATGDKSVFRPFAFDRALREIADIQTVPEHWMASDEEIAAKEQADQQAMQTQQQIQAAPAAAAMLKAHAAAAKSGLPQNMQGPYAQPQQGGAMPTPGTPMAQPPIPSGPGEQQ